VTGRKLPVPAPIIIHEPVYRDRPIPWQFEREMWREAPRRNPLEITCEHVVDYGQRERFQALARLSG
jgi:hypothetical protein